MKYTKIEKWTITMKDAGTLVLVSASNGEVTHVEEGSLPAVPP